MVHEPMHRRLNRLLWSVPDAALGLPPLYGSTLNWKGRALERFWALGRFPKRAWHFLQESAFWCVNEGCCAGYLVAQRWSRHAEVRSVLQLSIPSTKPYMLSRLLNNQGVKSAYLATNSDVGSTILHIGWDHSMPSRMGRLWRRVRETYLLWAVMARYDVIHSHFNTLLSDSGWEFEYLHRLGKVVIFTFRGCDLRSRTRNMQLFPELNCCQECDYPVGSCDTEYQRSQIRKARRFGDHFFVTTPDLREFLDGSQHLPFIHPYAVDMDAIVAKPRTAGVFRVVTSSNHHGIDGTRFVVDAVERLQREGEAIELIVVEKQPYREALSIYKSADVYVGKLRLGYYNNANIETMMLGVPNMSFVRDRFQSIAPDCPIIQTTPDTVYERLRTYLHRRDELAEIGRRGIEFVRRHHAPEMLARQLIDEYNRQWQRKGGHAHA